MISAAGATRYVPLFRNLARREVRQRYKGSLLGVAWVLVTPAIMVAAYSIVFKFLLRIDIPNYALFLFVGLTVWTFFMGGVQMAARSLVGNANLVTKVSFPRQIVPLAAMAGNAFTAGAMLLVALPLCLFLTEGSRLPLVLLPLLIVLLGAFTVGFGLIVAGLNVYFRDVEHIINAIAMPWIFLCPIFYSFDTVPGLDADRQWAIDLLHYGNPITPFILTIQDVLFWGQWPAVGDVVYSTVAAALLLAGGVRAFRRMAPEMAVEL
jgi:ABC-type polysaccharide/polyol phosphate export permease